MDRNPKDEIKKLDTHFTLLEGALFRFDIPLSSQFEDICTNIFDISNVSGGKTLSPILRKEQEALGFTSDSEFLNFKRFTLSEKKTMVFTFSPRGDELVITFGIISKLENGNLHAKYFALPLDSFRSALIAFYTNILARDFDINNKFSITDLYSTFISYFKDVPTLISKDKVSVESAANLALDELSVEIEALDSARLKAQASTLKLKTLKLEINERVDEYRVMLEEEARLEEKHIENRHDLDNEHKLSIAMSREITARYKSSLEYVYSFSMADYFHLFFKNI